MKIELLTIGDELLLGFVIDTNAAHLARELAAVGVEVVRRATVRDEATEIAAGVRDALDRTGGVVTTGGLGPTSDDMTKPAIAALFGRDMRLHQDIVDALEKRFRDLGYGVMPASNRQQAMIPDGARIIPNRHGSAPAIWLEDERGRWVAMLPGVPREMRGILAEELLPMLRERARAAGDAEPPVVLSRTLRTTGIGESALADRLGELARGAPGMPLAYNPKWEGVDLRLTASGKPRAEAERVLGDAVGRLRERVGRFAYGEDGADLADIVLALARERRLRVATAESCTGGLLGARITQIPGSSDVYIGGVVAYDNDVKQAMLDVPADVLERHGAVSEPVASAMAAGACARLGAEVGVGITGIAGPDGGTPDKPVGTVWIAVQIGGATRTHGRVYIGDRQEVRLRATQSALDMIRRGLLGPDV